MEGDHVDVSDLELMKIQADVLYRYNANGRIAGVNEPGAAAVPRFFLGWTRQGNVTRYHDSLPEAVVRDLEDLHSTQTPPPAPDNPELDDILSVLEENGPIQGIWMGPAFVFQETLHLPAEAVPIPPGDEGRIRSHFPLLAGQLADRQPCVGILRGGTVVSVCFSARTSPAASEAGLETLEPHRGNGYGAAAAAAWAEAVRREGRIPLYSTSRNNAASIAVARRLNLRRYGTDLSIY